MKVEITEIRKTIIEVSEDGNIDDNIANRYNELTDKDYSFKDTEMSYKVLPKIAKELNVSYKINDFSEFVVSYFKERNKYINFIELNIILYLISENYYNDGIKIFDDDFYSYELYPRSEKLRNKYFYNLNSPLSTFSDLNINEDDVDIKILDLLDELYDEVNDIEFYNIHDYLKNTIWKRIVNAGIYNEQIKLL